MNHKIQGPLARRRAQQLRKLQQVQFSLLVILFVALVLGAMWTDTQALQAGLIN